ncbi:MAG: DUF1444 family protein [Phycisphaeraceae bacterium]|nr:DUF1444 family protein [Phycisphaeraceae bacterium]
MATMPSEPQAFAQAVASLLKELKPDYAVELLGPRELTVNGRRLDLDNLFRMVTHEPGRGREIVEHYLEQLFAGEAEYALTLNPESARTRVMPRIQPESIFEHLNRDLVAHVPFVNGTVVVFVTDLPQMTVSITTEQARQWSLSMDDLDELARENLGEYSPELRFQVIESKEGGRAILLSEQDGYDAARLLLGGLWERLAPQMGGNFYVGIPARDMFVAISDGPPAFVARLRERIAQDYHRLPYPISPHLFYVTRDGVAGTVAGAMDDEFYGDLAA